MSVYAKCLNCRDKIPFTEYLKLNEVKEINTNEIKKICPFCGAIGNFVCGIYEVKK